jgi:membrane peptidoglycan carboxypeptidase
MTVTDHPLRRLRLRRAIIAGLALFCLVAAAVGAAAWAKTPSVSQLPERIQLHLRRDNASSVPLAHVAPALVRALVATEDERFYHHHGIDLIGLARAIPYDLVHASLAQGASTLTEQVAKLLYLNGNDHTPWRKVEDMALALKLENRYSKVEILDAYLNSAYFGDGAYGVAAASLHYFDVAPRQLTLAQASLLAGLPQAPSAYDPLFHPAAARQRQGEVLRSLVRVGDISVSRARAVLASPLAVRRVVLPAVVSPRVRPGPPLAWLDAASGVVLLTVGALLLALGRQTQARLGGWVAGLGGTVVLIVGVTVVLRSFRSL